MTADQKVAVFQPQLEQFETEEMRLYCEDMIKQIPDYIFEIASSTSGKFHNKTQCQMHGQVYHIVMFAEILNYLLALKHNKEKFKSAQQRDAMRCVPYFHDALKCGLEGQAFSVHEHPMLAGQWVRETTVEHDIEDRVKEAIARMCERHSGEFVSSKRSDVVLPEPENEMERIIHTCDILSSRNNIDMLPSEYLLDILSEIDGNIDFDEEFIVPLGKYKNQKLIDIYKQDPDYIDWMETGIQRRDVVRQIKAMKNYLNKQEENQ